MKLIGTISRESTCLYLHIRHLCLLGEAGGYVDAVEATGQNTDDKEVEDDADEVNATPLSACAICLLLLNPLFF